MAKFRKKPVVIDAEQYTGEAGAPLPRGVSPAFHSEGRPFVTTIHLQTVFIEPGDWIIPEPDGIHFYPCKPEVFDATYDRIKED